MKSHSSGSGGAIFASILITLIIVGAGVYFGLPYLYPNIKKIQPAEKDIIVQMKYKEFWSEAIMWDNTSYAPVMMNGTELNITTQGNTSLMVEFNTVFQALYQINANEVFQINLTLKIDGVGTKTVFLGVWSIGAAGTYDSLELIPFSLKMVTGNLTAGTYHCAMYWHVQSSLVTAHTCYLDACQLSVPYNNSRSLTIQEIAN